MYSWKVTDTLIVAISYRIPRMSQHLMLKGLFYIGPRFFTLSDLNGKYNFSAISLCRPFFLGHKTIVDLLFFSNKFSNIFKHINCPLSVIILEPRKPMSED